LLNRDDENGRNNNGGGTSRYIEYIKNFLDNKTHLFLVLSILFTSFIFYPLIIPHLYHPSMIFHISIHILSLNLALFLTVISILSFKKTKSKKVLLTSLSFSVLLAVEFLYLLQSTNILGDYRIPFIEVEIPHMMLLVMLTLFAAGVIRIERR
jgi:O-antigen ligase